MILKEQKIFLYLICIQITPSISQKSLYWVRNASIMIILKSMHIYYYVHLLQLDYTLINLSKSKLTSQEF